MTNLPEGPVTKNQPTPIYSAVDTRKVDWFVQQMADPEFRRSFFEEYDRIHREDIEAETERCAQLVECTPTLHGHIVHTPREIAALIRGTL